MKEKMNSQEKGSEKRCKINSISKEEMLMVLKKIKREKYAGLDGIAVEF